MKRIVYAIAALAALASCQKTSPEAESVAIVSTGNTVALCLSVNDGFGLTATKAAGPIAARLLKESQINGVQIFVFNDNGEIDNCKSYDGSSEPGRWTMPEPMECTTGYKDVWAVVNAPRDYTADGTIVCKADLLAQRFTLNDMKRGSEVDNLVMVGHIDSVKFEVTEGTTFNLAMTVDRTVSGITLTKVCNKFLAQAYRDKVVLTGAYLMQVPGTRNIEGTVPASDAGCGYDTWFAHNGKEAGNPLFTDVISSVSVPYWNGNAGTCYSELHSFYSMPSDFGFDADGGNPKDAVLSDGTDMKSSTYLIVEAKVNGIDKAYSIVLPKLEANKKYNVTLNIEHMGSDPTRPWEVVTFTQFQPSITVTDWTEVPFSADI